MASTYSNLKIQLMATGENSGTWGNVTNDNLGVAIEQALVETATVSFSSANVTLTLSNTNAAQDARALRLNLTGTTGGARDLIVPAIQKPYIVNNGTADTITVKVTGQTGVAVPAGRSYLLYNNGTDVVNAIEGMSVASGGTGTNTLTAESVVVGNGTNAVKFVAPGTAANVLTSNGSGWVSQAAATTTNASALTSGTTAVNVGGTGQTSYTDGQLLIGNTSTTGLAKATLTAGTGINITNGGGSITIATSGGGGGFGSTAIAAYNSPATFAAPPTTNTVMVWAVGGAGGGGGSAPGNPNTGGTGGQGAFAAGIYPVTGGSNYSVTIGTAGNGGTINPPNTPAVNAGNPGNAGNATSFGSILTSNGGAGGNGVPQGGNGNPGAAGTAPLSEIPVVTGVAGSYSIWSNNAGQGGSGGSGGNNGSTGQAGRVIVFY